MKRIFSIRKATSREEKIISHIENTWDMMYHTESPHIVATINGKWIFNLEMDHLFPYFSLNDGFDSLSQNPERWDGFIEKYFDDRDSRILLHPKYRQMFDA